MNHPISFPQPTKNQKTSYNNRGPTIQQIRHSEMGNKLKQLSLMTKTAQTAIGTVTICPNCEQQFPPSTTYDYFDQHVTQCLDSFRPSDQERLRMKRRKQSKDSMGSGGSADGDAGDHEDYLTVEVYVKKIEQQDYYAKGQHGMMQGQGSKEQQMSQKQQGTGLVPRCRHPFKWIKSHLTYSQSLLGQMTLKEISKQSPAYKILWLHHRLAGQRITWKQGAEQLAFHPDTLVQDSLRILDLNLYKELKVVVVNDVVHDAGGLLREWLGMLLKQLITAYGLFVRNKQGYYCLNPKYSRSDQLNSRVQWHTKQLGDKVKNPQSVMVQQNQHIPPTNQTPHHILQAYMSQQATEYLTQLANLHASTIAHNKIGQGHIINLNLCFQNQYNTYADLYRMVACLMAKAVIDKVTLPVHFDHAFLTELLGREVGSHGQAVDAIASYDGQLGDSLGYLLKLLGELEELGEGTEGYGKKMEELAGLCLTFSVPASNSCPEHELKQNGANLSVDTARKLKQYLERLEKYYLKEMHKEQIKVIKHEFYRKIKPQLFSGLLECDQFELLLNGVDGDSISIQDWKNGTQYREPYCPDHKVIKFFWATVANMTGQQKMRLLKFVTGSERLPVFGFKQLETNRGETSCFVIEPIKYDKKKAHFPKAHTCFNRLVLPMYSSEAQLSECLLAVVRGGFDGVWGME